MIQSHPTLHSKTRKCDKSARAKSGDFNIPSVSVLDTNRNICFINKHFPRPSDFCTISLTLDSKYCVWKTIVARVAYCCHSQDNYYRKCSIVI